MRCRYCLEKEAPPHRAYCCSEHRLLHYGKVGVAPDKKRDNIKPPTPEVWKARQLNENEIMQCLRGVPVWRD